MLIFSEYTNELFSQHKYILQYQRRIRVVNYPFKYFIQKDKNNLDVKNLSDNFATTYYILWSLFRIRDLCSLF